MTAVQKTLYTEQGATFTLAWNWYYETDPPEDPPAPDLSNPVLMPTGTIGRMQIRKDKKTTSPVLAGASTEDIEPGIVLGVDDGRIELTLTADDTMGITITDALYDFEIEFLDGTVTRLLEGPVVNSLNVTRDVAP